MQKPTTICCILTLLIITLLIITACKDPYVSPYHTPATGYLVVEGYISGNTLTQFTLSRTIPLPGDSLPPVEKGAAIQIQASDNTTYPLTEKASGTYSSNDTLKLNPQLTYRLSIKTANGEAYLSDPVPFKLTPPIDSISFVENGDNSIWVYANTHDPANNTHYYQWTYDQVYEYHSAEETYLYYDMDTTPAVVTYRQPGDSVFRCWLAGNSTTIILGSSTKLARDVIYEQPLKLIPPNDIQTSVLYTMLVRQYALTADGYAFLSKMTKNSESLGTIFDAQPTQLAGNIHSVTIPSEPVIGWVSAGTVEQQRLWISRYQIRSAYSYSCPLKDTVLNFKDSLQELFAYYYGGWTPTSYLYGPHGPWLNNFTSCLVCTTRGGTNIAPSYWPY